MQRNMKTWLSDIREAKVKKAMPVLSFPAIQLMGINVLELISSSDYQAQAMKLVTEQVDTAASLSLMDLSVEAECFGSIIHKSEFEVPTVTGCIVSSKEDAEALTVPSPGSGRTGIYIDAVKKAVELISDRPIFAGTIGPFSLAGRLMNVTDIMVYCYDDPEMVHTVMEKATAFCIDYALAYKEAGANGVVMAEPLTGILSPRLAKNFSAPYVKKIVDAVQDENFIVIYHNCGNNTIQMIQSILSTGAAAYHFGDSIDMAEMLPKIPQDIVVMGNVSPSIGIKDGTPESIQKITTELLEKCGSYPNFVISSGCDIPPTTKWENIESFFTAVKMYYDSIV